MDNNQILEKIKNGSQRAYSLLFYWISNMLTLVVIFLIVGSVFCVPFGTNVFSEVKAAYVKVANIVYESEVKEVTPAVLGVNDKKIECRFSDGRRWVGREDGFFALDDVYIPNITKNFSEGREMFCRNEIGTNFIATLKFTPLDEKEINVSINYGYVWRIIIGNGDYNQIQAQSNTKYSEQNLKGSDWLIQGSKDWIRRNGYGLKNKNQIEVILTSRAWKDNPRKAHIDLEVRGNPADLKDKLPKFFKFDVDLPKDAVDLNEYLGVGIIAPGKKEIKVKFDDALFIQKLEI